MKKKNISTATPTARLRRGKSAGRRDDALGGLSPACTHFVRKIRWAPYKCAGRIGFSQNPLGAL
ncbi:unnamed protein product [Sphenostylis stenocarpa]|uniref:Uncharacterized protein n=1 Tax=Sphenostylis stenocarpa TaxID=92480 RepID=A0AA86T947_9FABA|nr:unnamed protein product [Sphenostylis stenocarpa]